MNRTMFTTGPAQALETTFNISDYINFDFDFEAPQANVDAPSDISLAQPLQSMGIFDPYVGYPDAVDTDYAGISRLPNHDNCLANSIFATQASLEDLARTDALQTVYDIHDSLDDFTIFEPTTVAQGGNSAVLDIPHLPSMSVQFPKHVSADPRLPTHSQIMQEPSIWLPVSPQTQQHLNTVYASELIRQLDTANPALYFPAKDRYAFPTSGIRSLPDNVQNQHGIAKTSRPDLETTSISPSVLMHETTALSSQDPVQKGMHSSVSPTTDHEMQDLKNSESPLIKTRALDTSESDTEPAPKRTKTGQAERLVSFARDTDSDRDDEPLITKKMIAQQHSLPNTAKHDNADCESENKPESQSENNRDTKSGDSDNPSSSSAPSSPILPSTPVMRAGIPAYPAFKKPSRKGPNWRYEQAQEVRLREQRRREWQQRRTKVLDAKAPNRKMQKLLKEIEDSHGFAEAQDYRVEGRLESEKDRGSVRRRPVRKGVRKTYVGQE